jgi:TolA-binding protein
LKFSYWKLITGTSLAILCLAVSIYLSKGISTQNPSSIQGNEMSQVQVSVFVDNAHLPQIEQVSQQLQSSGMNVEQILASIGVINGSIPSDLDQIEGEQSVELQQGYQLAPPNSELQ